MKTSEKTAAAERYQTPIPVAEYMADYFAWGRPLSILEPTPGNGNIVKVLEARGHNVFAPTDLFTGISQDNQWFDGIVMNPPFSHKTARLENCPEKNLKGMEVGYYFVKYAMRFSHHIVALVPWFTLIDSDVRTRFFFNYGLVSITMLPRKTFDYDRIATCIIVLSQGYKGATELKKFNW